MFSIAARLLWERIRTGSLPVLKYWCQAKTGIERASPAFQS